MVQLYITITTCVEDFHIQKSQNQNTPKKNLVPAGKIQTLQAPRWSLSCSTWTRTWWKSGSQGGRRGKGGGLRFFIFAYIIIINGGGFHSLHHIAITSVNEVIKRAGVGNAILLLIIIVSCLSWRALHMIYFAKVCSSSEQIWEDTSWREEDTVLSGSFYFNVYSRCTL